MEPPPERTQLPSGKVILRQFNEDRTIATEHQVYGALDIGITFDFKGGTKVDETYFVHRRMVGRKTYEKARAAYADMPAADDAIEDTGSLLLKAARKQQRQNKAEAEQRLAESAESRFPRPASTNWLRVISGEKSHLVIFASRDWKVLARESAIPTGRRWLDLFGFNGPPERHSIAKGLEVGFEVTGDTQDMLDASRALLNEVNLLGTSPPLREQVNEPSHARTRKQPPLIWQAALPPLIEFLDKVHVPWVKIFNHHR